MIPMIRSEPVPLGDPASVTWLAQFGDCLRAECRMTFGGDWKIEIDARMRVVRALRVTDGAEVSAALHPGLYVVRPVWAAHRISDQLELTAIALRYLNPPPEADMYSEFGH
jgi:hypothetical protein